MVYFTGDTHGRTEKVLNFAQRLELTAEDTVVILGDAGMNYYDNEHGDKRIKKRMNSGGMTVLSIHGNHERRPAMLPYYREEIWRGGTVYIENEFPNLLFAKDGEIFDLEGRSTIVIGGAYSVDKYYRLMRGVHWFEDEQPSDEIKKQVEERLESCSWQIDTVLSHTCPERYIPVEAFLPGIDQSTVDRSTEIWLDDIESRLSYKHWLCGHWHIDKRIDRIHFLMNSFETL